MYKIIKIPKSYPTKIKNNTLSGWATLLSNVYVTITSINFTAVFIYSSDHDSVLHVTNEDYASCNAKKPLNKFTDGHTVYKLNQSGSHYFISGVPENCHKNEKFIVVVLVDRIKHESNGTAGVLAPLPSEGMSPPSPAPIGEESPPPPPEEETNPTSAPSEESSPSKNSALSVAVGVVGTIAVLFGSSLALALWCMRFGVELRLCVTFFLVNWRFEVFGFFIHLYCLMQVMNNATIACERWNMAINCHVCVLFWFVQTKWNKLLYI